MATTVARLEAYLTANTSQYTRKMREAEGQTTRMGGVMDKAKVAAIGFGVAGVAVVAEGLKKSVEAALDAQKSQARLEVAFRNAHLQAKVYEGRIKTLESASRKLGFTDEDVKNSLGSLITASGSYTEAAKELATAQDLARFKNVDLQTATKALTMLHAGSTRALKQLGIQTQTVTDAQDKVKAAFDHHTGAAYASALADAKVQDKQATMEKTFQIVTDRVHGQADAYSKTAAGAMEQFKSQLTHVEVAIGEKLLPAMTKAIQYVMNHWPQITAVIQAWWTSVKPTLNAFGDLITSVVQLVRTHWSTIGPIVRAVVGVFKAQLAIIGGVIKLFAAILRGDWSSAWGALKGIVRGVLSEIKAILTVGKDVLVAVVKGIGSAVLQGFSAAISAGWKVVKGAITGLFGKVIGWVKGVLGISSPSAVFHSIGRDVVHGFINGVGSMAGVLKNAVIGMAKSALPHLKSPFAGDSGSSLKTIPKGGTLGTLIPWAKSEGMTITSTTGGTHAKGSYHYQGRAIDVAGTPEQDRKFFLDSWHHFGSAIRELFYDPMGFYIKNGQAIRGAIGGHSDHVHLALGGGGIVTQAMNALIGERGPEAVIPLNSPRGQTALAGVGGGSGRSVTYHQTFNFPNYVGSQNELAAAIQDVVVQYEGRNGRPMGGGF